MPPLACQIQIGADSSLKLLGVTNPRRQADLEAECSSHELLVAEDADNIQCLVSWEDRAQTPRRALFVEDSVSASHIFPDITTMPLKDYLQEVTARSLELANILHPSSYNAVLKYFCTSDFKVSAGAPEVNLAAGSLEEHARNLRAFLRTNPDYHVEVLNTTILLDAHFGAAIVFTLTRTSGLFGSDDTARETIHRVHWRRVAGGRWLAYELTSLRGPGHFPY